MPIHNFGKKSNKHPFQAVFVRILSYFEIQNQFFHVDIKNPFRMTKNTVKSISFLRVLNWVRVHDETEKYVEIISTALHGKVKHAKVFQGKLKHATIYSCSTWFLNLYTHSL